MTPSRRAVVGGLTAAVGTGPALAQTRKPVLIAHRGASGERPEHTLAAYRLAIEQGADFIEPDLVATRDGVLVCRHESALAGTTDVAAKPNFASRARVAVVDGRERVDWHVEDFTSGELATLRARERLPDLRPGNARFDGQERIPTFQQVIDLARSEARRLGRPIGVCPELKTPAELAARDVDLVALVLDALNRAGLPNAEVPVMIQCFEAAPLRQLRNRTRAPLVQLTSLPSMLTAGGLREIASYAQVVSIEKSILTPAIVDQAHRTGLQVQAWTFRAENAFLPEDLRLGADRAARGDMASEIRRYVAMGVDGIFSDFPGLARAAL